MHMESHLYWTSKSDMKNALIGLFDNSPLTVRYHCGKERVLNERPDHFVDWE